MFRDLCVVPSVQNTGFLRAEALPRHLIQQLQEAEVLHTINRLKQAVLTKAKISG